ncbi:MAG: AAA family ATPase, partial [Oribacterium sp.]|nr:AAA family ATPase [Oribacterium sp.]
MDPRTRRVQTGAEGRCCVIIDEIQCSTTIPDGFLAESVRFPETALAFYDTVLGLMGKCDLYITGSNSHMLSSDSMTNFRGVATKSVCILWVCQRMA